jgi:hypothetical protein
MPRTRTLLCTAALLLATSAAVYGHDLFLRAASFFPAPNSTARIRVLNGTFSKSEGAVAWARVVDLSRVVAGTRARLDSASWSPRGDTTILSVPLQQPGTYLVGASLLPRTIRLTGEQFNEYLQSDGLPDVLEARRAARELEKPAHERYAKHVKTLLQVGETRTDDFATVLGYPAELVPLANPYAARVGSSLRVRALVDGVPVAGQVVIAGGRTPKGNRIAQVSVRTDSTGVARIRLRSRGSWYVKFIHMVPVAGDSVDYESKWATLTFGVR